MEGDIYLVRFLMKRDLEKKSGFSQLGCTNETNTKSCSLRRDRIQVDTVNQNPPLFLNVFSLSMSLSAAYKKGSYTKKRCCVSDAKIHI